MKKNLLAAAAIVVGFAGTAHAGGPNAFNPAGALPDAQAGQCFARITLPAVYDTVPETVVVKEAFERLAINETQFGPSSRDVQVKDEGVRYQVRQPVYETVTEQVLVKPAHERLEVIPARFETVTETIIIEEARKVWKAGATHSSHRRVDEQTGQVYCLVDVPAKTKTVSRRVLVEPERIERVPVEAQYVTVQKQVLVDRGGVTETPTEAEYKTVATQEILNSAHTTSSVTPAQTKVVERTVLRTPERFEWVEVLCDTNAQTSSITDLQSALRDHGYYNGPIDGIIGPQTELAVRKFQESNGLPHQGFVTMETLRMLGLASSSSVDRYSSHTSTSNYAEGHSYRSEVSTHTTSSAYSSNEVMMEEGVAVRHNAYQSPVREVLHETETVDRAASMANDFEAYASEIAGNGVAHQQEVAPQEVAPLTTQTTFERPQQYSVRNRLDWDAKK